MDVKELFTDDDAVSPVIGVILMVAITVILAAVIASFVLGLGNNATKQTPTASFVFEYEQTFENDDSAAPNLGVVSITHDGGDTISDNELYVRGTGINATKDDFGGSGSSSKIIDAQETGDETVFHQRSTGLWNGTKSGDDSAIVSGDFTNVPVNSDYDLSVNYEAQEGQSSATLQSDTGPDA